MGLRHKTCKTCNQPLQRRRARYCTVGCKRQARNERNANKREFDTQAAYIRQVADNLSATGQTGRTAAEWMIELADYLPEPDGRTRPDFVSEVWEELQKADDDRRMHITVRDCPLPSDRDIDEAELTGDWAPMVRAAVASMGWQLSHGYQPDLTDHPTIETALEVINAYELPVKMLA